MFLDTSALFAIHHVPEPFHFEASEALKHAPRRLTHGYVLAELVALTHARRVPRGPVLRSIDDMIRSPAFEIVWIDDALHEKGMALLRGRLDKTYSLCDAISFVLMREQGIQDALTTDRHFEQEGFRRLLA